jgi:predicted aspartyl protease
METETMGRVTVEATIENLEDLWAVKRGLIEEDQARKIVVADALVDTGKTLPSLPTRLMEQLGLSGALKAVRLTILGRTCSMDVKESSDATGPTIGHMVLTHLDLVVDPESRTLIGNPAHGGVHTYELY